MNDVCAPSHKRVINAPTCDSRTVDSLPLEKRQVDLSRGLGLDTNEWQRQILKATNEGIGHGTGQRNY
jgi:hypothetical protein